MNVHEYQAKILFSEYDIPVPPSQVVNSAGQVRGACNAIKSDKWVIKAQVHAGGRGKAGGVKKTDNIEQAIKMVDNMLGSMLVTDQTDNIGKPINKVLIEATANIVRELYLGLLLDRVSQRVTVLASTEGGMDIEAVAAKTPEKILHKIINPLTGVLPFQCRELAFSLGLVGRQVAQFTHILTQLAKLFVEKDLSLIEVNPLVLTESGDLYCLDAKINIDDNALFRHPELVEMHDKTQEDPRENRANGWDINYVALDGNIGCLVNGAGLAMATMDIIKLHGGAPANFLDVGGGATKERVKEALKIIVADGDIAVIFVNIFGGIVRCDLIAEGIIAAAEEIDLKIPVVVRLEGNNADLGRDLLNQCSLDIIAAQQLQDAAQTAVDAANKVRT